MAFCVACCSCCFEREEQRKEAPGEGSRGAVGEVPGAAAAVGGGVEAVVGTFDDLGLGEKKKKKRGKKGK